MFGDAILFSMSRKEVSASDTSSLSYFQNSSSYVILHVLNNCFESIFIQEDLDISHVMIQAF